MSERNSKPLVYALVAMTAIFCVLRFLFLSSSPPGFFVDEASIGLNASQILENGSDEHGVKFPLFFEAFGDFKNPVFVYSAVPLIFLFGKTVEAVRLTSVVWITAMLSMLLVFLRVSKSNKLVIIITLFLIASNPWVFHLSRVAFEVSSFPFFHMISVLIFYLITKVNYYERKKLNTLLLGFAVSLGWLFFTYTSARVLSILFLASGLACIREKIDKRQMLLSLGAFLLTLSPMLFYSESIRALTARYQVVGLSGYTHSPLEYLLVALGNFIRHFDTNFILFGDNNLRHVVPGFGLIYICALAFVVVGVIYAFKKEKSAFVTWLGVTGILSIIPSAVTIGSPHVLRSIGLLVPMIIFCWHGVRWFVDDKLDKVSRIIFSVFLVGVMIQSMAFLRNYFFIFPSLATEWFDAGVVEGIKMVSQHDMSHYYADSFYTGTDATVKFFEFGKDGVNFFSPESFSYDENGLYLIDRKSCEKIFVNQKPPNAIVEYNDSICLFTIQGSEVFEHSEEKTF